MSDPADDAPKGPVFGPIPPPGFNSGSPQALFALRRQRSGALEVLEGLEGQARATWMRRWVEKDGWERDFRRVRRWASIQTLCENIAVTAIEIAITGGVAKRLGSYFLKRAAASQTGRMIMGMRNVQLHAEGVLLMQRGMRKAQVAKLLGEALSSSKLAAETYAAVAGQFAATLIRLGVRHGYRDDTIGTQLTLLALSLIPYGRMAAGVQFGIPTTYGVGLPIMREAFGYNDRLPRPDLQLDRLQLMTRAERRAYDQQLAAAKAALAVEIAKALIELARQRERAVGLQARDMARGQDWSKQTGIIDNYYQYSPPVLLYDALVPETHESRTMADHLKERSEGYFYYYAQARLWEQVMSAIKALRREVDPQTEAVRRPLAPIPVNGRFWADILAGNIKRFDRNNLLHYARYAKR